MIGGSLHMLWSLLFPDTTTYMHLLKMLEMDSLDDRFKGFLMVQLKKMRMKEMITQVLTQLELEYEVQGERQLIVTVPSKSIAIISIHHPLYEQVRDFHDSSYNHIIVV